MLVGYLGSILEEHGIACMIKNTYLLGAAGEIPPTECWPELWVADEDSLQARRLLRVELSGEARNGEPWTCPDCGEPIEGQFTQCWRCGTERP